MNIENKERLIVKNNKIIKIIITTCIILFISIASYFIVHNNKRVNIYFCINSAYTKHMLTTIYSILKNTPQTKFHFFILTDDLSSNDITLINKYIKYKKQKVSIINVNTDIINNGKKINTNEYVKHVPKIADGRLLITSLLPKNIHTILYLDSDILVVKNIKQLYELDLNNNIVGMAQEEANKDKTYRNAGVILIDFDKWRQYKVEDRILYLANGTDFLSNHNLGDQDLLNYAIKNKIQLISNIFNRDINYYNKQNATVIHYLGKDKPWMNPEGFPIYTQYQKELNNELALIGF